MNSTSVIQGNIERLMIREKIRLVPLAKKAGISKGLLWKLMADKAPNPSLSTLDKIATAFSVSTMELFRQ